MRNRPIPRIAEDQKAYVRRLVLYEDDAVLAFNKPSGLAVQTRGNRGTSLDHLLWTFARSNGKRPQLVHRIDAGTSGLILAGKTKPAIAALSTEFAERRVKKRYLAFVRYFTRLLECPPHDAKRLQKLRRDLLQKAQMPSRPWLLERIDLLLGRLAG